MKISTRRGLSLSVLTLGLLASAAGATPAMAKDKIVVCTIDDLSGDFSIMSTPKTYGYRLAVKEINDAGGVEVDGKKKLIDLVQFDGQSDVKRYQELAQRCVFDKEADVVMAGYTGAEREAARREVVRNKTIYWHNNQGEGGIADHYSFFSGPTPEQQVLPAIKQMIEKFGPRMTFIGADYNFCRAIGQWVRVAAGLAGGKIEMEEYFPFGVSQWQATIDKIKGVNPDFQVHCLVGAEQVQFYPQAQAAGLKTPVWSNVTITDGYEHKRFAPPSLANIFVPPGYIEDVPGEASKTFASKIRAMFPETVYVNEHAAFGYVAVKAMAEAWKKAGTTDTEKTIAALESDISIPDAPGGPWSMRGSQHHAAMHTYLFKVNDDHTLSLVSDLGMTEPTFLTDIGVDMRKKAPNRQFLPADNPAWKQYLSQSN
ncbi:ABC transporter substrate-binding protein [Hansschlegelia plantiphila]|uniref:Urea ABC transporter substrate-binding protein n=1 Tax=Hansschlegelia plantiphila TaxID=374655 RepID=A0A9W6IZG3_9HYPH|nr:ABC transporter substrate-binding protein [Hansschlegelia plantiphila]GLK66918.1 urea ABC transporter substrate-binding protein [Hansschlegelia plantiphila]